MADKSEKTIAKSSSTRRQPSRIPKMVESGDPEQVMATIHDTYGFRVTRQFASDFIAFVEKMTRGL